MRLRVRNSLSLFGGNKCLRRNRFLYFIADQLADFRSTFSAIKFAAPRFLYIFWVASPVTDSFANSFAVNTIANADDHTIIRMQMRMTVNCIYVAGS